MAGAQGALARLGFILLFFRAIMKKLHFSESEFAQRRARALQAMAAEELFGLLIFRQESSYYLTGFDTYGFVFFTCLYLGRDGQMTLLTRTPDLRQAQFTSVIEDIRIWIDGEGANPALQLRDILEEHGCRGKRIGIELDAYGLTGRDYLRITEALEGRCTLVEASHLVSRLRLTKSDAELVYVRRAAALADGALELANSLAVPGAFEGDILAAMMALIFKGDGDFPAHDFIIGSGPTGLLWRYHSGRRRLDGKDQLALEFGAAFRHYHANHTCTILTGEPDPLHLRMHEAAVETLLATRAALKPGHPIGEAFAAHARILDAHGFAGKRMHACGYSLGAAFIPNWMDWPMLYRDNPIIAEANMVFFITFAIMDTEREIGIGMGQTVVVTDTGWAPITRAPLELVVNR